MKLPPDPGHHVWPSPSQERLLMAALARNGLAEGHFRTWLANYDIEGVVDEGTYRTLPLLWYNLVQHGVDHPLMPRLKGVFRNAWVTSKQAHLLAARLIAALAEAGVATLVSKGLPLSLLYYEKPALRPMADVDIIVRSADIHRASDVLAQLGFEAALPHWESELALRHAVSHRDDRGEEVDLHWHVIYECPTRAADSVFWNSARPFLVEGAPTLAPSPTDLLTHVLIHGVRWNLSPPMRWIPDAIMILRSEEEVNWNRLFEFAVAHGLGRRVALGLGYLHDRFEAPVPPDLIASLYRRASLADRVEIAAMRAGEARSLWRHARRSAYALRLFKGDDARSLPRALAFEAIRRVGSRLRGQESH